MWPTAGKIFLLNKLEKKCFMINLWSIFVFSFLQLMKNNFKLIELLSILLVFEEYLSTVVAIVAFSML